MKKKYIWEIRKFYVKYILVVLMYVLHMLNNSFETFFFLPGQMESDNFPLVELLVR